MFASRQIRNEEHRERMGISVHPDLDVGEGKDHKYGVVYPLLKAPDSTTTAMCPVLGRPVLGFQVRYLDLLPWLKFSTSIPNFFLWDNGLHDSKELVITEGFFDAVAVCEAMPNVRVVSPLSGYFSEFQFCFLLDLIDRIKPHTIRIMMDTDAVGMKTAYLIHHILTQSRKGMSRVVVHSYPRGKDAAEHFVQHRSDEADLNTVGNVVAAYKSLKKHDEVVSYRDYLENRAKVGLHPQDWEWSGREVTGADWSESQ